MITHTITREYLEHFAKASGDRNCVHFGDKAIAHGVSVVSWAIAEFIQDGDVIVNLTCEFIEPIPVGSEIELRILNSGGFHNRLGVYLNEELAVDIELTLLRRGVA